MPREYTPGVNCGALPGPVVLRIPIHYKLHPELKEAAFVRGVTIEELCGEWIEQMVAQWRLDRLLLREAGIDPVQLRREECLTSAAFRRPEKPQPPAAGGAKR